MTASDSEHQNQTGPGDQIVLWDFDGTLADTLSSSVSIYNDLATQYGFRTISDPSTLRDLTTGEIMQLLGIPIWKLPGLARRFMARQKDVIQHVPLFPGIEHVLRTLRNSGVVLGIVSSNSDESIRLCLRANNVEQYFAEIVGYARLFGKHLALRKTMAQRSVHPRQILYIGDEVRDIEAAARVSVEVAAVTWGWHSSSLLSSQRPTYLINEASEILDMARFRSLRAGSG